MGINNKLILGISNYYGILKIECLEGILGLLSVKLSREQLIEEIKKQTDFNKLYCFVGDYFVCEDYMPLEYETLDDSISYIKVTFDKKEAIPYKILDSRDYEKYTNVTFFDIYDEYLRKYINLYSVKSDVNLQNYDDFIKLIKMELSSSNLIKIEMLELYEKENGIKDIDQIVNVICEIINNTPSWVINGYTVEELKGKDDSLYNKYFADYREIIKQYKK